jgi:hypothetical protein
VPVLVGAVRWDWRFATTTSTDPVVRERAGKVGVLRALEHPRWQDRAPAGSAVMNTHRLSVMDGQEAMDSEILAAKEHNLGFWLFLRYPTDPTNDTFNRGLALYQTSEIKADMPWCSLEQATTLGAAGDFDDEVERLVEEMEQPHYLKVLTNRPLVGVYGTAAGMVAQWGSLANFKTALDALRADAQTAGLGNPYLVAYVGADAATATALGADAVSDYIGPLPTTLDTPYTTLDTAVRAYWATLAAAYAKIVPVCMAGWHRGPRMERPDWSNAARTTTGALRNFGWRPYMAASVNVVEPSNTELVAHVQAAVDYVVANPAVCDAGVVSLYAWNEQSEGGYICPTRGNTQGKINWLTETLADAADLP